MFATVLTRALPTGLDEMPPGPELAAVLAEIDVRALDGYDRVVVLRAEHRMAAHYQARCLDGMAAVAECMESETPDLAEAMTAAAAEIRAALHLTRRAADAELGLAWQIRVRLPRVWELLSRGEIDIRRARVLANSVSHLPLAAAHDVVEEIAGAAPQLTTGQLRARLQKLCIEVDPDDADRRYREATADRRVVTEPTDAGTANLVGLDLPPHELAAAMRNVNRIARSLRRRGEARAMDQLRADVLLDLLSGSTRAGRGGVVEIQVDLATLAELSDAPGELAGYGPVIADIARQVAGDQGRAEWRYSVTDSETGRVLHTGTTRRRPTTGQRRAIEARRPICVFPGCRMPASQCDLDHRRPYAEGGPTTRDNLDPLCRHDHGIKANHGWTYRPLGNGDYAWTSRLGHTYTTSGVPP